MPADPFNLYALVTRDRERALRRIPMERSLQNTITNLFERQAGEFTSDNVERVDFDAGYKLDDGELFVIRPFPLPSYIDEGVAAPTGVQVLQQEDLREGAIKALAAVRIHRAGGRPQLLFQTFTARQLLSRDRFSLLFSGNTFTRLEQEGLSIGDRVAAVYDGANLLFDNFAIASRFLDLTNYFREATDLEVNKFIGFRLWQCEDPSAVLGAADGWVRRKVSSIRASGVLDALTVKKLLETASHYGIRLETTGRGSRARVTMPLERQAIKNLIRLIDEDYLDSPLTGSRFQVSSKRKIDGNGRRRRSRIDRSGPKMT